MIGCVGIGTVTGSIFLVVLLFVGGNIEDVIESAATPLVQIFKNATGSNAGSICLLMYVLVLSGLVYVANSYRFPLVCILFAATTIMATSSRMIYAFAR